jgi:uncharacterized membrane protein
MAPERLDERNEMTPDEKQAQSNRGRYLIIVLIVLALVIAPFVLYLVAAPMEATGRWIIAAVVGVIFAVILFSAYQRTRKEM